MTRYELNRTIKLNNESEYSSLYSWSLEEYDSEGKKVTEAFIPMQIGSIYLDVENLTYHDNFEGSGYEPKSSEVIESEHISGKLKTQEDSRTPVYTGNRFSMFGTDREIKEFGIEIYKVDNSDRTEENFHVSGYIGWKEDGDLDVPAHDAEDALYIIVVLKEEKFNKIVQHIKDGINAKYVRIGNAEGFYNRWTPSIHLEDIKILTDAKDYGDDESYIQQVEIAEECDITPPRLGKLKKFNIGFWIGSSISFDNNNENDDEDYYKDDFETDNLDEQESSSDVISSQLSQISDLGKFSLGTLRLPLWIIAITLLLILIYK